MRLRFMCLHWRYIALEIVLVPNPFFFSRVGLGGSESVGGHLRGDKERSFSSVTHFDRGWSKVPERDAGTVA